ncbi:ATPase component BioM of energizing module of biotin ECF transporter [Sinorhizobium sojae CCBAU 05684]|uniref:ATPase component BioM of energizing module of biotin ECF transporter n=1 Tax=Sinorhizobium sojae CCBAU 05684 TaxID=716928 RepID=A0A249PF34_9HYPH|nr:cell division protein ZapE [Sinorhizobium sojae]ASY64560.1 ATPase component BioM of energizing module of biotin ECF transporter [Sinorhizobium sojae CCBAU 05684]
MLNPDDSILHKLETLVARGEREHDSAQAAIARRLDRLTAELLASRPSRKANALGWLFAARKKHQAPVKGLYIHGGVGRGKTMLMDMFFDAVPIQRKRRAHFHEFMADVHERIYRHRQKLKNVETKLADPIPPVASELLGEARLLCFDEFSVTDIADAMILARLFGELFAKGCVLVATSNVEPSELYRDGLNRGLFLPFIDLLKSNAEIISLDTETDYRLRKTDGQPVWLSPLGPETEAAMDRAWYVETGGAPVAPAEINRKGRKVHVPATAGHSARFTFSDLCAQPLGAADYLAILSRYRTIFLDHVPHLGPQARNETKRFIILVDTLYDQGARLFASAVAEPQHLLTSKKGTEGFEFDRTVSRLIEMQSAEYAAKHPANLTVL